MQKKERQRIGRLYDLIDAVPFPASGTKSTTIAGLGGYAEDMRQFTPAIKAVLLGIMALDCGNKELIEDEDYKNPDEMLTAMELWVNLRSSQQWQGQPVDIASFYKRRQDGAGTATLEQIKEITA
jgi:hypothetical protein